MPQRTRPILGLLALALLFPLISHASDDGENTELWNELKVTAKWTPNVDLFTAGTFRFEDNFSVVNRVSVQLGLNLRATSWLTFSPNYQYIIHDPAEDVRKDEHRPGAVTAVRIPVAQAEVTLSAGVEYRFREDKPDSWRVRLKIKLKHPLGPEEWMLSGYVANELFYDTSVSELTRDRLFAGFEKKIGNNWSIELYYCHQYDLQDKEPDLDIVGLSIGFRFDLHHAPETAIPPLRGK